MADKIFEHPRLAKIYDFFDGDRQDLVHYLTIAQEFKATTILDVGCGTGSFTNILANNGFSIIGVEPAEASLNIARNKTTSNSVQWILGDTDSLPAISVEMAFMTGNVAQVFVTNESWQDNLRAIHKSLAPNGKLVFEVRDPSKKDWVNWNRKNTYQKLNIPGIGNVEGWCDLQMVKGELVRFRWTYVFENDQETLTSDSTLIFRSKEDIIKSLAKTGFEKIEVRGAPDRPGREFVFIAEAIKQ